MGIYSCREGFLGVTAIAPPQWRSFCELLGLEHWLSDPGLQTPVQRWERVDEMDAQIAERLQAKTATEWFELTRQRRLPIVAVPSMAELLASPVMRAAGAFGPISAGGVSFEAPTTPLRLTATPPATGGEAPALGSARGWRWTAARQEVAQKGRKGTFRRAPWLVCEILDLSMGWAGPLATRQLADLGADVFKIEACAYPDWWRPNARKEERPFERNAHFAMMNRGKFGATIDLYREEGRALLKSMLNSVDAVVENYAADVMPKLGLTYDDLRAINPSLVMLSMPAFSGRGDWKSVRAYGSTLEHGSGLPSVSGQPSDPPCRTISLMAIRTEA